MLEVFKDIMGQKIAVLIPKRHDEIKVDGTSVLSVIAEDYS